jgi:hypothetical protein
MNPNSFLHIFVWFALSALVFIDDAQAYIDPGTGSMVIQSLIAVIAGGLFAIKTYWHKLKMFFSQKQVTSPKVEKDQTKEPE